MIVEMYTSFIHKVLFFQSCEHQLRAGYFLYFPGYYRAYDTYTQTPSTFPITQSRPRLPCTYHFRGTATAHQQSSTFGHLKQCSLIYNIMSFYFKENSDSVKGLCC